MRINISETTSLYVFLLVMKGVFGADPDEVKSVSVSEGDSVALHTDVTEVHRDDQILWLFGLKKTRIAQIYNQDIKMFNSKEMFGDRLKMDSFTGSLSITNITITDSGLYKLEIHDNSGKSEKTFNLTVYARLPVPVITSNYSQCSSSSSSSKRSSVSRCSLLCSVVNVGHVTLSWFRGNSLLSSISVSDLSISLSLPLEVEYQDNNTYSCVLNNTITSHTTHLDIREVCQQGPCPSSVLVPALITSAVLVMFAVVMFYLYRKYKRPNTSRPKEEYCEPYARVQTVQTEDTEAAYAETTFVPNAQSKKPNGIEETIYSTVKAH